METRKFEKALALITMVKNTNNNVRGLYNETELEKFFKDFLGDDYDAFYYQAMLEMREVVEEEIFHAIGVDDESEMDWNNPALERYVNDMIMTFANPYKHSIDNTHEVICQIQHDVVGYIGKILNDKEFEEFLGWYDETYYPSDILDHICAYNLADEPLNRWDSVIIKYCVEKGIDYQIFFTEEELAKFAELERGMGVEVKIEEISSIKGKELCVINLNKDITELTYCVHNTSDYCGQMGVTIVQGVSPLILKDYGFDDDECKNIGKLDIGGTYISEDYGSGVIVVRLS